MRPALFALLLGLVGPLLLCRGVWSIQSAGLGRLATSLCAEIIRPNGYSCIEHKPVTDDGFILGLQNIPCPRGQSEPAGGPPVLLQHGVTGAGDNFVSNSSPYQSLGFALADAGFDVWIANNRAVQWSHGHVTLNSSDVAYWDWTYDELASYDLKAITEYVYNQRNRTFGYIGHSQGTLMIFAGLTGGQFKTQIQGYLNAVVHLTPVAFVSHITPPLIKLAFQLSVDQIIKLDGNGQFDPKFLVDLTCTNPLITAIVCSNVYWNVFGQSNHVNNSHLDFYSHYYPQATSTFNINHYGESFRSNTFQFYSRGFLHNPPKYDLTTFPSDLPQQWWAGGVDALADPTDVSKLLAELPRSNNIQLNTLPDYGHIDFIFGVTAYIDVYPDIMTFLLSHAS
ncbi:unnamed protein product [Calypogeia fissa]